MREHLAAPRWTAPATREPAVMRRVRLGALLLVPVLAACGGGGGAPTSGATTSPGGTTTPPATTGAGATTVPATAGPGALATGGPVSDLTRLCELLGPGDFGSVAIDGAGTPSVNTDGPGSAYCTYAGSSAASGGIEFDVFVGDDPAGTFQTILGEGATDLRSVIVVGADEAVGSDGVAGQPDKFATLVVRKGNLVFAIAAPAGPFVPAALNVLALEVLSRGAGLAG